MSLQLILGGSGSGKTYYMTEQVVKRSMEGFEEKGNQSLQKMFYMLVPEQFTMETQRNITKHHPRKGTMNIDIVSFLRLAQNVFADLGVRTGTVLDDMGKTLMLRKVLQKEKDSMEIFGAKIKKEGFIQEMKSVLSELYQYGITEKELKELVESPKTKPLLRAKLSDVRKVFEAFREEIGTKYLPAEEILKLLCSVIQEYEPMKGAEVYLDGFTGFTPVQYQLIECLMKICSKVTISLTLPTEKKDEVKEEEQELFLMSIQTKNRLLALADKNQIPVEDMVLLQDQLPKRLEDFEELAFLEKNIFRYGKQFYEAEPEKLRVFVANNPGAEVRFVAEQIQKMVRYEGYRYRDIGVITGDIEGYSRLLEREFRDANIPFFMDQKRDVMTNPLMELVRSLLQMLLQDFSYESVFRYLRSGMTNLEQEEVDILENFVLARGFRGYKKWSEEWTDCPGEEELRLRMMEKIMALKKFDFKDITVREFTGALYETIAELGIYQRLEEMREQFEGEKKMALAREYSQIYQNLMSLFQKIVDLIGEEHVTLQEYSDLLDAGISEIKVGIIPPTIDQVMAGDIQRSRLSQIKALFVLGVNDGIIPKSPGAGGIFTEMDRRFLQSRELELAPSARENSFIQKYYLYLNLTKPSEKLYLSYSQMNQEGKALRASYLIGEIKKMFPALKVEIISEKIGLENITGRVTAFQFLADALREKELDDLFKEIYIFYLANEEDRKYIKRMVDAAFFYHEDTPLDGRIAKEIYGDKMECSVTKLESFASCAYKHFMTYGLELSKRELYDVTVFDIGNLYHKAIEVFSAEAAKYKWEELSDEVRINLVNESVRQAMESQRTDVLLSNARNQYLLERLRDMTDTTTKVLCEHVGAGKFVPMYFEHSFSNQAEDDPMCIELRDGSTMHLKGVLDRVDLCVTEDTVYVKIIDYKSGNTSFDLDGVFQGRQMQLTVYMQAILQELKKKYPDKKIVPAAELYYRIRNEYVEKYGTNKNYSYKEERKKSFAMSGLVNEDQEIQSLIDEKLSVGFSNVIEMNGKTRMPKNCASTEHFEKLGMHMEKKAAEFGSEIMEGNIKLNPFKSTTKDACKYCDYKSICRFDEDMDGYEYRREKKLRMAEIWDALDGKENASQETEKENSEKKSEKGCES